jgi:hypothetical protein
VGEGHIEDIVMRIVGAPMYYLSLGSGVHSTKVTAFTGDPKVPDYGPCSCGCKRLVNNASRVVADYPRSPTVYWCATDVCVMRVRAGMPQ